MDKSGLARAVRRGLRKRFGWCRLYEARNKIVLAHTAISNRRFENAEVRRLTGTLLKRPSAMVVVVTATYRRPELLVRSVKSALAQSLNDLAVIVVDDGGGLPELPSDPRVTAVSLARNTKVLGVVLNVGIRISHSRYVAFLDDDNEWERDHLAQAVAALEGRIPVQVARSGRRTRVPDVVYTALNRRFPDGTQLDVLSVPFDRVAFADGRPTVDTNALVARRMRGLRFSRLSRSRGVYPREDWELAWRLSRRHHIGHVPQATVRYLVNPESYYSDWTAAEPPPDRPTMQPERGFRLSG